MCIILTCESGVRPDYDLVENCFYGNPDGAGLMWCEDGKVQLSKGYTDPAELMKMIESVPSESPVVIHMRIATSGGINVGTCHPFPITSDLDLLHAGDVECNAAIAHNGVIKGMPTDEKKGISDTVFFVQNIVSDLYRGKVTRKVKNRIRRAAPGNRFAILTSDGRVYRLGEGWETVTKGIEASNATWRWSSFGYGTSCLYAEDFDEYEYEYKDLFDQCCGDCTDKATCMKFGPFCDDVADLVDYFAMYGAEQTEFVLS